MSFPWFRVWSKCESPTAGRNPAVPTRPWSDRLHVETLEDRCLPSVGATLLADIASGTLDSNPTGLTTVPPGLFFAAGGGKGGRELWTSDGSPKGTVQVKDINPGIASSNPQELTRVGGVLLFTADDGTHGRELWTSDGSLAGTKMLVDISNVPADPGPQELTAAYGTLFFTANSPGYGRELWRSDGTANSTRQVRDIYPYGPGSDPQNLTVVGGRLYFTAVDPLHGRELWTTDGSNLGTVRLSDIVPGPGNSTIQNLTAVGGKLFFAATDGQYGNELWVSDGSAGGTMRVKDINTGPGNSNPQFLTNVNGTAYFSASDTLYGTELWTSDGTDGGTFRLRDINSGGLSSNPTWLTNVGGMLYFAASDSTCGDELWTSDGTGRGTVRVKDINHGINSSLPSELTNVNGRLYFAATDANHGDELWTSDGTLAGTFMVRDVNPGTGTSFVQHLTNVGGTLFFDADDGSHGRELWKAGNINPPLVSNPGAQSGAEGTAVSLAIIASNPGGPALMYTASGLPPGLHINATTGVITGTPDPTAAFFSPFAVTVTVSDGTNSATADFSWDIADVTTPVPVSPGSQVNKEGNSVTLAIQATDADGDPLRYDAVGLPTGLTIDPTTGVISGTIAGQTAGSHLVFVSASDRNLVGATSFTWTVTANTPPVVTSPGPQGSNEGNTVGLMITASDPDGDPLTFGAGSLPAGLTIDPKSGLISGTLGPQSGGSHTVMVTVGDGIASATTTFTWVVGDLTPPSVVNPGPQSSNEGNTVTLALVCGNPDNDPLTYMASGLPAGLHIDTDSGVITGTIGNQAAGHYQVMVTATDGSSISSVTFAWTVGDLTVPVFLSPGNQINHIGDTVVLSVQAADPDGDALNYYANNLPPGLFIDAAGVISGTLTSGSIGSNSYTVTIFATDGLNTGYVSFVWTVL